MQLESVNKLRYRRHLNIVIVASIAVFASASLGLGQVLIALFPDPDGSHFHWNLLGVIISALIVGSVLKSLKHHPFMTEVTYIWELKQTLNKITRKMRKLEAAAADGDVAAMQAMQFSYSGSRLLWELDDNTLVMEELSVAQAKLDALAAQYNVTLDPEQFSLESLRRW
jgi:hypothetical protein